MKSKENIDLLKRLQKLEIMSCRLLGAWLPGIERWEHKHAIAEHLWMDAKHSRELRIRLWELKVTNPDRAVAGRLDTIVDALGRSQSDLEFLAAHYLVFKTAIVETYRELARQTYQVYDAPTVRVVRLILSEKETQLSWAESALEAALDSGEKRRQALRWQEYIRAVIAADGGIAGRVGTTGEVSHPVAPPATHISPLPFAEARRDERFELVFRSAPPPPDDDPEAKRLFQFVNYAHEMQAAETLGSILWEADGMEWDFYHDLARHCYDEARHAALGEHRLAQLGHHITDFPHCVTNYAWRQLYDPLRRYCILTYVIEADSFKYKQETYQRYLAGQDMESAEAVLYDITDETLHVRWGQRWVPKLMEQAKLDQPIDDLVKECRSILLKHSVNPMQLKYAQLTERAG